MRAGTIEDHADRFAALADAGVNHAVVALTGLEGPEPVERFAPLVERFAETPSSDAKKNGSASQRHTLAAESQAQFFALPSRSMMSPWRT